MKSHIKEQQLYTKCFKMDPSNRYLNYSRITYLSLTAGSAVLWPGGSWEMLGTVLEQYTPLARTECSCTSGMYAAYDIATVQHARLAIRAVSMHHLQRNMQLRSAQCHTKLFSDIYTVVLALQ